MSCYNSSYRSESFHATFHPKNFLTVKLMPSLTSDGKPVQNSKLGMMCLPDSPLTFVMYSIPATQYSDNAP